MYSRHADFPDSKTTDTLLCFLIPVNVKIVLPSNIFYILYFSQDLCSAKIIAISICCSSFLGPLLGEQPQRKAQQASVRADVTLIKSDIAWKGGMGVAKWLAGIGCLEGHPSWHAGIACWLCGLPEVMLLSISSCDFFPFPLDKEGSSCGCLDPCRGGKDADQRL